MIKFLQRVISKISKSAVLMIFGAFMDLVWNNILESVSSCERFREVFSKSSARLPQVA